MLPDAARAGRRAHRGDNRAPSGAGAAELAFCRPSRAV